MKNILLPLFASITTFILPATSFIYLIGLFITLDTLTALIYAYSKRKPGRPWFKSNKFFNFGVKIAFYSVAILASYAIDIIIMDGATIMDIKLFVTKVITMLFCINELVSINETYIKVYKESMLLTIKKWIKNMLSLKKDLKTLIDDEE